MKITIYGCGYVGLVTGTLFADAGNDVLAVDIDEEKIDLLNQGIIPIYEPGLEEIVRRNQMAERLHFSADIERGAQWGEVQFIAVGTPSSHDGSADMQYVLQVARQIGSYINQDAIIVDKSTVPVGTADRVRQTIDEALAQRQLDINIDIVSNPEFLKEGAAIADFMKPDRIVIGADSEVAINKMRQLYAPFNRNHDRLLSMDIRSAELTKYAANALLATKISFINEISRIAEAVGADIEMVRQGIGSDPRIGYHFIYAGCGYGGSCFPKDVRAITHTAQQLNIDTKLLSSVSQTNEAQKKILGKKVIKFFADAPESKQVGIWGGAFKANTDDIREAPILVLLEQLWAAGIQTSIYDPKAGAAIKARYPEQKLLQICTSSIEAITNKDALVIVTDWREFKSPNFKQIKALLKQPVIFDGRNLYDPQMMQDLNIRYFGIGRGEVLEVI